MKSLEECNALLDEMLLGPFPDEIRTVFADFVEQHGQVIIARVLRSPGYWGWQPFAHAWRLTEPIQDPPRGMITACVIDKPFWRIIRHGTRFWPDGLIYSVQLASLSS